MTPPPIEPVRAWTADAPLSELTLMSDWGSVSGMIESLRLNLFEYHTIPLWNFTMCMGRPELATPFSWAYTPTSLVAYLLPGNLAILAVWVALTALGIGVTRSLLLRYTGSGSGATVGACLFAFNAFFVVRFMVGHVTFAFLHLVPLLLLCFETSYAKALAGERLLGWSLLSALSAFLFFSAGLPHGVYYFYPALPLLVLLRVAHTSRIRSGAVRACAVPLGSHVIGLWLALYKLWPAISWQLDFPREIGSALEDHSALTVLWKAISLSPAAFETGIVFGPPHASWIHLGPVAIGLAAVGLWAGLRAGRGPSDRRLITTFASLLVIVGFAMSLGNSDPWAPATWLRALPFFSAVRMLVGYQVLVALGLSVLAAQGLASCAARREAAGGSRALVGLLALLAVGPVVAQAGALVWRVSAVPNSWVRAQYEEPLHREPPAPLAIRRYAPGSKKAIGVFSHQTTALREGAWIANCVANLSLPGKIRRVPPGLRIPLSEPPPIAVERLTRDRITLLYPPAEQGRIILNLGALRSFEFDAPITEWQGPKAVFRRRDLRNERLTMRAVYPGPVLGASLSLAGAVVGAAFFAWLARRESRAPRP